MRVWYHNSQYIYRTSPRNICLANVLAINQTQFAYSFTILLYYRLYHPHQHKPLTNNFPTRLQSMRKNEIVMSECDNLLWRKSKTVLHKVTAFKIFKIHSIILRVAHYPQKNVQNIQGDAILLFRGTSPNTRQHFVVNIYRSSFKIHSARFSIPSGSHVLPCLIHGLNVLFGLHP